MTAGLISNLSTDLSAAVSDAEPAQSIDLALGRLDRFEDPVGEALLQAGFLNVVLVSTDGTMGGIGTRAFAAAPVVVKHQEKMKELNASYVTEIGLSDDALSFFHWDGFTTTVDPTTLAVMSQTFTK